MRHLRRGLLLVAGAAALSACAASAPVNSTATAAPAGGAPATAAAHDSTNSSTPVGYRRVVRKGTEYFCRNESVTGSHTMKNEVCLTREEFGPEGARKATAGLSSPSPAQVGGGMPSR